jgi:hypothetical protein
MYKFLVVGCGGSGGATLAYMMDQLKSELAAHGIDRLPAGWQFLHIDVPNAPDTREGGVDSVAAAGGRYISTAPATGAKAILPARPAKQQAPAVSPWQTAEPKMAEKARPGTSPARARARAAALVATPRAALPTSSRTRGFTAWRQAAVVANAAPRPFVVAPRRSPGPSSCSV